MACCRIPIPTDSLVIPTQGFRFTTEASNIRQLRKGRFVPNGLKLVEFVNIYTHSHTFNHNSGENRHSQLVASSSVFCERADPHPISQKNPFPWVFPTKKNRPVRSRFESSFSGPSIQRSEKCQVRFTKTSKA